MSVCLFVCFLSAGVSRKAHGQTSPNFMHAAYGRVSVLLWRRCDSLRTSGFGDDVMFSHNDQIESVTAETTASVQPNFAQW